MRKTVIFLGAGASKAEGAPLQGELFSNYFSSYGFNNNPDHMDNELATFFQMMFNIDVYNRQNIAELVFPTFEEVLGLTDLAILRHESFRGFDIENRADNSGRLRHIAQYLVFLVAKVLEENLRKSPGLHQKLVQKLKSENLLKDTAFVSTNYDILIDNALENVCSTNIALDYGVEFRNQATRQQPRLRMPLYKPHGSLNWLFCPTCNQLQLTRGQKGVVTHLIMNNFEQAACPECASVYMPLIVPPTFYKDLSNVFLSSIWNQAETSLRGAEHIIFCGYSFPDADIHIKYLLKRAQTNRDTLLNDPQKFTVINHFPNKKERICDDEKLRFTRFLGQNVDYSKISFEEFANNPLPILNKV